MFLFRDVLTLTETESRLSLGMTSNKTYHFQTTANHHRIYWHEGVDEIQNKAEAQPAWLQLAAGATAGA